MKENIAISVSRNGNIITVSFSTQKHEADENIIRRILRSGQFTGEIAGYNMDYFKRGVIIVIVNDFAWKGPESVIEKLTRAIR